MTAATTLTTAARGVAISGRTRLFAVLGDPIAQVRSPALLNPLFAELGRDAVLVPVHVRSDALAAVVEGLRRVENLEGLFATVPHKAAVLGLAADASPVARLAGSANVMRRSGSGWHADNVDGAGFVAGLRAAGLSVEDRRVWLAGAGGAGGAIAVALLGAGVAHLRIGDVEGARARALAARLGAHWPGRVDLGDGPDEGTDLAVNATPLGMRPDDPVPFDVATLAPGCVVADVVMEPPQTALLRAATARGLPTHPGQHMLDHQVPLYREFFGLDAPERQG